MIIPIPWHSADIRLKNSTSVWSLIDKCPSFTRMVTEYHGFIFLVGRFNRFFNCLMITSILWHSADIRMKNPQTRPCHLPFAVSSRQPWACAASCKAYTSKHDMGLIYLIFDRSNSLYFWIVVANERLTGAVPKLGIELSQTGFVAFSSIRCSASSECCTKV